MAVENHFGEYRALYICCRCLHSSRIPLAMSLERGEGAFSVRSRVNRKEAFDRPTSSKETPNYDAASSTPGRPGRNRPWEGGCVGVVSGR